MIVLSTDRLSFAVGHVALLDEARFQLEAGEKVGLIGRNGTGKSSFLKILAGLQKADDGNIVTQTGLKTVFVAQEPVLDHGLNVFDAVGEGLSDIRNKLERYHMLSTRMADADAAELEEMGRLQTELDAENGWIADTSVRKMLEQFGLPEKETIGNLSGGQRKKAALARALVQGPDILLLDEPTNHLDIDAVEKLEDMLQSFSGSLVVITHDRRFLDHVAGRIVELDRGVLRSYPGNYEKYSEQKAQELVVEAEHNRLFDKFHAQEEAWIRKGIEARRTRNQGRVKRLEQLRRDRTARREVQGKVSFTVDQGVESGKIVAEFEHACFSFEGREIMQDFSTVIRRGDKIGLIGPNGIGKTTFLKLVLGELQPQSGNIKHGSRQEVAYFDQFRSALNEDDTVFYTLGQGNDYVDVGGRKKHVIGYLSDFLFPPERAQSPVKSLSGGERNRLLLAKLFTGTANILVLDEPTNDLDTDTQELLEDILREYEGTVFLVSHDRALLDNVVTQSIVFKGNGILKEYIGGYEDYRTAASRENEIQATAGKSEQHQNRKSSEEDKPLRNRNIRTQKLSYKEQRELERIPEEIEALESEQNTLTLKLNENAEVFKENYKEAMLWQNRITEIEDLLAEKLERWDTLESKQSSSSSE